MANSNHNNEITNTEHPDSTRRTSGEALDEKHRLQLPQLSVSQRPRPRVDNQHRVGAFPIAGRNSHEEREDDNESITATRPSISSVIPVAAMVVEDFEREELSAKEQQLREQERELAEKMQRLQTWEAELHRQKNELERRQRMDSTAPYLATSTIVEAELVEAARA